MHPEAMASKPTADDAQGGVCTERTKKQLDVQLSMGSTSGTATARDEPVVTRVVPERILESPCASASAYAVHRAGSKGNDHRLDRVLSVHTRHIEISSGWLISYPPLFGVHISSVSADRVESGGMYSQPFGMLELNDFPFIVR